MVFEPRGVVAVITPWNDPVAVSCGLIGAALATGNTVVYKPSERTPATGWLLADLLSDVLPDGVLSLVLGAGTVGAGLAVRRSGRSRWWTRSTRLCSGRHTATTGWPPPC
jgi:succinate-semialdehyde dehydrogenase/glutarate-semialdehyde dehydrogenase